MLDKPKAHTRETKRSTHIAKKSPPEVYALRAWSVMKAGDNWYVAPTACFDNKPQWSKPYASLYRATTAIARKLVEKITERLLLYDLCSTILTQPVSRTTRSSAKEPHHTPAASC
jgi:hypothetical protein